MLSKNWSSWERFLFFFFLSYTTAVNIIICRHFQLDRVELTRGLYPYKNLSVSIRCTSSRNMLPLYYFFPHQPNRFGKGECLRRITIGGRCSKDLTAFGVSKCSYTVRKPKLQSVGRCWELDKKVNFSEKCPKYPQRFYLSPKLTTYKVLPWAGPVNATYSQYKPKPWWKEKLSLSAFGSNKSSQKLEKCHHIYTQKNSKSLISPTHFQRSNTSGIEKPLFSYTEGKETATLKRKKFSVSRIQDTSSLGNKNQHWFSTIIPKTEGRGYVEGDKGHYLNTEILPPLLKRKQGYFSYNM